MKKVININFQGRVIPIEETAYELLKQYVESLRRYFANEEGREEIINDIEARIAELFSERLKKGVTCITDDDVKAVITSMGRPEDFDAQGGAEPAGAGQQQQRQSQYSFDSSSIRGRLYRNADDKILGGVCSGLANYFRIDPVFMRIIFVVFIAALFWVYIILWIIVPSQSIQSNITKRLYRSSEDKVIAGVCGGLAAYFNIEVWIPRLIFALPLILGLISGGFEAFWWDWDFGFLPRIITGSLGSTLFITYVILWISVPVATTAAEKLEMKGEKINLNSIRDTVKEDLSGFRTRAEKWGNEVKESAQQFGQKAKEFSQTAGTQARTFASETGPAVRRGGSGLGRVIGVLFKAFFLFVAGIVAIALFAGFIGILFGGMATFPLKNFILDGFWQNVLAWSTLFLFFGIPIIALITWLIRRIIGVRSKNHYLGYVFGSLWTIGLISAIILGGILARNFKSRSLVEREVTQFQPPHGKLFVEVQQSNVRYYGGDWFGFEGDDDLPFYGMNEDTLLINTVRLNVVKSQDSAFHIFKVQLSRGYNPQQARELAEKINFEVTQRDSLLLLPKGFAISRNEKFRNQKVLVVIEVPVGKRIQLDRRINNYNWFNVDFNRRGGWDIDWNENWDRTYGWNGNQEYIMTPDGLVPTDRLDQDELKRGRYKEIQEKFDQPEEEQPSTDTVAPATKDSVIKVRISASSSETSMDEPYSSSNSQMDVSSPLSVFSKLFQ
ncbi:MAG TPA: PspC domain-containing protein [Flavitalea sp.]|nr:PspC domain-containing protein [Flavitalea sp.]